MKKMELNFDTLIDIFHINSIILKFVSLVEIISHMHISAEDDLNIILTDVN